MFHFIVGLFLVGLIIMWMIASPAFRNFVLVVVLVIGGGIWWLIDSSNKTRQAREYVATTSIKPPDLKLENVNLKKANWPITDFLILIWMERLRTIRPFLLG
jgi:hypothetical protein